MTRDRMWRRAPVLAAATGLLASLLTWNVPVGAVAYPGINGKLACGGTLPTSQAGVSNFEVYSMNPDGELSGRT